MPIALVGFMASMYSLFTESLRAMAEEHLVRIGW